MPRILVLNCGSSSVKFALFALAGAGTEPHPPLCSGSASRLNDAARARLKLRLNGETLVEQLGTTGYDNAIEVIVGHLRDRHLLDNLDVAGHRVVHGGDAFRTPTWIDSNVCAAIEHFADYAPLHNPANLAGIRALQRLLPALPQIAVFDTAFHTSLAPVAYHYAVPAEWYHRFGVRRYGFHGINHQAMASTLPGLLGIDPDQLRAVSAHLGNGCSLCAIHGRQSVDTSMGFTPLEGLVMGTRSGDLDPGLHEYLCHRLNISLEDLTALLNHEAGLKGVSGISNDMRELLQAATAGHTGALLAVELFCYRLAKSIASYIVPLGRIDTIAFTGGIGENAAPVRERVIGYLHGLGFRLDSEANSLHTNMPRNIAAPATPPVWIIPAREEWEIASEAATLIHATGLPS